MGAEFVAMEVVDGQPLPDKITRRGLPPAEALKYVVQIADALAAGALRGLHDFLVDVTIYALRNAHDS
jgi:hypothetical protein